MSGKPSHKVVVREYDPSTGDYIDVIESNPSTAITIYNTSITDADTEYSQLLPDSTKQFFIKLRSQAASLRLSFTSGQAGSGGTHVVIPANGFLSPDNLNFSSITLYFESPTAAQVAEIIAYT